MDLRFGDSKPTDEERAAVDALLGPPESSWEGAARDEMRAADLRWARGGREARDRRDLLLPGLHAINDRVGWISEGALDYLCRRLTVPPAEAYGVATFYAMFSVRPRPATVLHVCTDLACAASGAADLCAAVCTAGTASRCARRVRCPSSRSSTCGRPAPGTSRRRRRRPRCAPTAGVGCNLTLHVQDNEIVKVTSPHDNPVTHGNLCIKGRFGYQHVQNRD